MEFAKSLLTLGSATGLGLLLWQGSGGESQPASVAKAPAETAMQAAPAPGKPAPQEVATRREATSLDHATISSEPASEPVNLSPAEALRKLGARSVRSAELATGIQRVMSQAANPDYHPTSANAAASGSSGGSSGSSTSFRAPAATPARMPLPPVEMASLEEQATTAPDPRWRPGQAGNEQIVGLMIGGKSFRDISPYNFLAPPDDLDRQCPQLANLKITVVIRFGTDGTLKEIVAADQGVAPIARDVFDCQLAPRTFRGEPVQFKTFYVPRAR